MQAGRKRSSSKGAAHEPAGPLDSDRRHALADASNRRAGVARGGSGAASLSKFECGVQMATMRKFKKPRRVAQSSS